MDILKVPVPDIYTDSSDFRFFMKWIEQSLSKIQFDTENFLDLYDPLRCPSILLWMLADTIGFKYDDRLPTAYNRLVLLYFMSMIRNRGSRDGMVLAAETNLAQFNVQKYGEEDEILFDRLDDTSIPVNSAKVIPHTEDGYIEIIYVADKLPIDACIEYVRPLGMYCFQYAGVEYNARTKISVDARLMDSYHDNQMSIGPTHIGHYRRDDYARMQPGSKQKADGDYTRHPVYYRNSEVEVEPDLLVNPGYRTLYSLQLCNNDHIVSSLIDPEGIVDDKLNGSKGTIFGLGYQPQDVSIKYPNNYRLDEQKDDPEWNLRYDKVLDEMLSTNSETDDTNNLDLYIIENYRNNKVSPIPAVNPIMNKVGDSISLNNQNSEYSMMGDDEHPKKQKVEDNELKDL